MTSNDTAPVPLRRITIHQPGESLLVSASPVEMALRFRDFQEMIGVANAFLYVSPLVTTPIPVYPASAFDEAVDRPGHRRRWAGVHATAMWHPLTWLTPELAFRRRIGSTGEWESNDHWVVRLAIEMAAAGLYDESSGAWTDMLSTVGIDIEVPDDLDRVEAWLSGGVDDVIESIDLGSLLVDQSDSDWAIEAAESLLEGIWVVTHSTHAISLLGDAEAIVSTLEAEVEDSDVWGGGETRDAAAKRSLLGSIADETADTSPKRVLLIVIGLAGDTFANLDSDSEEGAWWALVEEEVVRIDETDSAALLRAAQEVARRLAEIRDDLAGGQIAEARAMAEDPTWAAALDDTRVRMDDEGEVRPGSGPEAPPAPEPG